VASVIITGGSGKAVIIGGQDLIIAGGRSDKRVTVS
jgi:hypothetical protein